MKFVCKLYYGISTYSLNLNSYIECKNHRYPYIWKSSTGNEGVLK